MKLEYLINCARYKYKALLNKGEWQTPDAQGKIISLRAELRTMKSSGKGENYSRKHNRKNSK